jgi:hypothetical protein
MSTRICLRQLFQLSVIASVSVAGCSNTEHSRGSFLEDPLDTVFLKITCVERGRDGRCNKAACEREPDPNSPTGYEFASCAQFLVGCEASGHEASGDRENATCERQPER